uniref:(northern house mosquito) hypothetical protein n=1 Tax=Culex pipiens TaxID=7175 RepID=A0A8D8HXK9_CULPI
MFLEILTKGANTKSDKSKSFRYWKQNKINSQATKKNNHNKTSSLLVPFGYKLWKLVVKKTYKYRGKQKQLFRTTKANNNCAQKENLWNNTLKKNASKIMERVTKRNENK